jgi:hypothetical protein
MAVDEVSIRFKGKVVFSHYTPIIFDLKYINSVTTGYRHDISVYLGKQISGWHRCYTLTFNGTGTCLGSWSWTQTIHRQLRGSSGK